MLAASPLAAKIALPADIAAAQVDDEFRCIANWTVLLTMQSREPNADLKSISAHSDRLDPFVSEVQNKFVDVYRMTNADMSPIFAAHAKAAKSAYENDKAATLTEQDRRCIPIIEAREAIRTPHSPQRCAALIRADAILSSLSGVTQDSQGQIQDMPNPVAIMGLVQSVRWEKWAIRSLIKTGNKEAAAQKMLASEKKLLEKETKAARKAGRAIVFDRLDCERRFVADNPAAKPPAN